MSWKGGASDAYRQTCGLTDTSVRVCAFLFCSWCTRKPISQIPIDLLFLHFAPHLIMRFRPDKKLRRSLLSWWSEYQVLCRDLSRLFCADPKCSSAVSLRALRLSSYFFGPNLTGSSHRTTSAEHDSPLRLYLDKIVAYIALSDVMRGQAGIVRVPASDSLSIVPQSRMFVRLNAQMEPLDEEEAALMEKQNLKATNAGRNYKTVRHSLA